MTDLKRALEYAAMKADQRDYNDRRLDDANLKACLLELAERLDSFAGTFQIERITSELEMETRRGDRARAVLRNHLAQMKREGEVEAATATGEFSDCDPCECAGCTTYRLAVVVLGEK